MNRRNRARLELAGCMAILILLALIITVGIEILFAYLEHIQ